jgi:ureidoglycolate lyase
VPMGVARDDKSTKYLVVVAPTLPAASEGISSNKTMRRMRSIFFPWASTSSTSATDLDPPVPKPKGTGLPDLRNLRAFLADGSQAVTYGPGTWHAPMVALGDRPIDFVVVQYANGVGDEDCQEVEFKAGEGDEGVSVVVEAVPQSVQPLRSKL